MLSPAFRGAEETFVLHVFYPFLMFYKNYSALLKAVIKNKSEKGFRCMSKKPNLQIKTIVESWQRAHPSGGIKRCIKETGISFYTVKKYWNPEIPENFSSKKRVADWFESHPDGSANQCAEDLHLSVSVIKLWRPSRSDGIVRRVVETWQYFHPGGSRTECCRATGLSRYEVSPYFVHPTRIFRRSLLRSFVKEWLRTHPGGNILDCSFDLHISIDFLADVWNSCLYDQWCSCSDCTDDASL